MAVNTLEQAARIAVIGAGIAGLSCAAALQQSGLAPQVFDKSRGAGGRMSTRRAEGWQCDHGAQYFTARDHDFRAEVARWEQAGAAALWQPRLRVIASDTVDRPLPALQRFVGTPRMSSPAAVLAAGLTLNTGTTIAQLRRTADGGWNLLSHEHGWLEQRFDAVVLALPAPQAASLLQTAQLLPEGPRPGAAPAGQQRASALAALATLASGAPMTGCWTLMLRFAAPPAMRYDAAFVNHGPLRWVCRNNSKPGRSGQETWLLHASAAWSEAHLEHDTASVAALLLQAFAELGGPSPQAWTAHRWRYAMPQPALELGCAWDAGLQLGLCGDWLNGGKVEGAWLSGQTLARRSQATLAP